MPDLVKSVFTRFSMGGNMSYGSGIQPFFFVRVPPDIIPLQLCTPKVVGT
jgi:hypothetical protein